LVPSDLVIVPRSLALALPAAVTVPVAVTGGQAPAHAPEQADVFPVSLTHRYTARPEPSVSTLPADDVAVVMTVAPDPLPLAAPVAAGLAGAELLLLPPLEHAAARTATAAAPTAPEASLATGGIRIHVEFSIRSLSLSWLARFGRASDGAPMPVDTDTGRGAKEIGPGGKR
jgi:hypothetical protein